MQDCKVNILGTEYIIYFVDKFPEHLSEHEETATGLCNTFDKEIHVKNFTEIVCKARGRENLIKNILMHELIHAFLYESGLGKIQITITLRGRKTRKWLTGSLFNHQRFIRYLGN